MVKRNGWYVPRNFDGEAVGQEAVNLVLMQDKGGKSSKFVIRILNRDNQRSWSACSMIGSCKALHADGMVPEESYKNFKAVLDGISGLQDPHRMKVVQIG